MLLPRNRLATLLFTTLIVFAAGFPQMLVSQESEALDMQAADVSDWPQEILTTKGTVVIYQPEPESLDGHTLKARAAISIEATGEAPVFGAVWFEARLETDRSDRTALITDLTVIDARLPNLTDERMKILSNLLESEIPKWNLPIHMDELISTLEISDQQARVSETISTQPPVILFYAEPAVLITIDGEPSLGDTGEKNSKRVMNTPFTILQDTKSKTWYLNADEKNWYKSKSLKGDWQQASKVPKKIAKLAPEPSDSDSEDEDPEDTSEAGPPPRIVLATEPTELISSNGKPEFSAISGTDLLYVSNTDSDVLMNSMTQEYYVLLSGRWFVSKSLDGPWVYTAVQDLPGDFAKIPEDNEMGTVLYAVPGTDVSREAVMDAQVPQTSAINRKTASLTLEYDGKPKFEKIPGTQLHWAANTSTPVIRAGNRFYAVDEAVWFVSNSAEGPWSVATEVPDEIYTITPESPVYNVTFVRIYGYDENVVYVGYTPGYTNTYVYNTTIVYGTGYYYPGWYGNRYYPRYSTWGFHVRWNPWTGWNFGLSYSYGPFTFYFGRGAWYRGGWWGPGRYRGYRRGYRHGYRSGRRSGYRAGYQAGQRNNKRQNMYKNSSKAGRTSPTSSQARNNAKSNAARQAGQQGAARSGGRSNNVYSDKSGNVYRQTDKGWQQRSGEQWSNVGSESPQGQQGSKQTGQKPTQQQAQQRAQQPSSTQGRTQKSSKTSDLNRSSSARQRGTQRSNNYNRSRSGSGGARRGGGRRR